MQAPPELSTLTHVAVLGNALPRQCGLATYTSHSVTALRTSFPDLIVDHIAMDDGHGARYGSDVTMVIPAESISAYARAAATIDRSGAQLLWLHHEFGIFGGPDGEHILTFLEGIDIPLVTTLHTVRVEPSANQRRILRAILRRSDRLIVMARHAAELLVSVYGADPASVTVIPHGAPDRPLMAASQMKAQLGLGARRIALTFGLLSPGKGIETAIRALPQVLARHQDLDYLVVGATHPSLLRAQGERYREGLQALAGELGVAARVKFIDCFLENDELLDYLQAADIYLTPYLDPGQVTSGTLAYALAMGRPVISTPYFHAREALADGIGTLVPFGDGEALASALLQHLDDPSWLVAQSRRAWQVARKTIWRENARAVMKELKAAKARWPAQLRWRPPVEADPLVDIRGIALMTDDVGIVQHSIHGIPDRRHGYCIDDNARALMLICETRIGGPAERHRLALVYSAFVEHGWNADTGRFRNFMGFDRQWCESEGSEDSNGRTLWALGTVMASAPYEPMRRWATGLFNAALPLVDQLRSPRAQAFAMLGMATALRSEPGHAQCRVLLARALSQFMALLAEARRPSWCWFETVLAYDNARLPQAMIEAGCALKDESAIAVGTSALRWLLGVQRAPAGHFRPVGTESYGKAYTMPEAFDQQPLEAAATVDACVSAYRAEPDESLIEAARQAMGWFAGDNDLGRTLLCDDGALCLDGLTPVGVNRNIGAESILALHMARHSMAMLRRAVVGSQADVRVPINGAGRWAGQRAPALLQPVG
jgi:glycosyltransferase involved in cell wall biosynthesis